MRKNIVLVRRSVILMRSDMMKKSLKKWTSFYNLFYDFLHKWMEKRRLVIYNKMGKIVRMKDCVYESFEQCL